MADTEYQRLIQAAKDRALSVFPAALQRAIPDADRAAAERQSAAPSGAERSALTAARHILRQDAAVLIGHAEARYRHYLERAFQTMFVDLRADMRKLSADTLTLIDDEVVNRQIEVGRLADRIREAHAESVGRLSLIIAQMHGQTDARERENPFRPYLLARAVHESVDQTARDEARSRMLFELLSTALVSQLAEFYEALQQTFDTHGLRARYVAQRSRHHAVQYPSGFADAAFARLLPGLQRMLEALQVSQDAHSAAAAGVAHTPAVAGGDIKEFMQHVFSARRRTGHAPDTAPQRPAGHPLVAALQRLQKQDGGTTASGLPELLDIAAKAGQEQVPLMERMRLDVVSLLFACIAGDDAMPAEHRRQIARLQIPLLKAALLDPELLQDEEHPARQLLNRLGAAAASTGFGEDVVSAGIAHTVQRVLDEYDTDKAVFASCDRDFEALLADHLRSRNGMVAQAADAAGAAERYAVLLVRTGGLLRDALQPLNVDQRLANFIVDTWPHVLVHACWQDAQAGRRCDRPDSLCRGCCDLLPELLWSVQHKPDAAERSALMRALPDLVKRLRAAMAMIEMQEAESRAVLDLMMELHTRVLRGAAAETAPPSSLDALRQACAAVVVDWEQAAWSQPEPPRPHDAVIRNMFARSGVTAALHLAAGTSGPDRARSDLLARSFLPGTRVSCAGPGRQPQPATLVWVSAHRSLYLFRHDGDGALALYTCACLHEAVRNETLVPADYAPVFERAIDSLLEGASRLGGRVPAA